MLEPPPIYGLADANALAPGSLADGVEAMADAGIRWIQVRAKRASDRELLADLDECRSRIQGYELDLWVNDRCDVAVLTEASGVHLGQHDLPPEAARRVVGARCWIGRSTHDLRQLQRAEANPEVDVIAVGPVFATTNKERPDLVVGLELVRRAAALVTKPLVAIGGIEAANVASVLEAGADTVAVIGALSRRGSSIARNARALMDAIR